MTNAADSLNSLKIRTIRHANGNPGKSCPLCGHASGAPYRRVHNGRIIEGCVDAHHSDALYGESLAWHMRPVACELRKQALEHLKSL